MTAITTIISALCAAAAVAPPPDPPAPRPSERQVRSTAGSGAAGAADASEEPGYPDDLRIYVASRLLFADQLDDAATVARTVVEARPDCDRALFILGLVTHKQKRYDEARPLLEKAAESSQHFPERPHVRYYLGWCCYHMGDLPAAKRAFERHAAEWPNFDDSHFGLGVVALDEGRLADAEAALKRALELQEDDPYGRRARSKTIARLGDVAERQGRLDLAVERYEHSVELWPDHPEAWSGLAKLHRKAGREEEAKRADAGGQAAIARAEARAARIAPQRAGTTPPVAEDATTEPAQGAGGATPSGGAAPDPKAPDSPGGPGTAGS